MYTQIMDQFILRDDFTKKILSLKVKAHWGNNHSQVDKFFRKGKRPIAVYINGTFAFNKRTGKEAAIELNLPVTTVFRHLDNLKPLERNNKVYEFKDIQLS